jgi:hypothetical protein
MTRLLLAISIVAVLILPNCLPESKLLKRNYVRADHDLNKIDTLVISHVYTSYYDKKVFGYRRNKVSEEISWDQIPKKIQRKFGEFGVTVATNCSAGDSVHRYLPNRRISKYRENDKELMEYLDLFEKKEQKEIPGCNCGKRYVAVVFHLGSTRTMLNSILSNSYFFPIQVLTLGLFKVRWNEGYSQMRFIIYDCQDRQVVYNGINSRYLVPSDSITVFKHLEILLAKYKDLSDSMNTAKAKSAAGNDK